MRFVLLSVMHEALYITNNRRLVGAAVVPRVEGGDIISNAFLMLPTDALAVLSAEFLFE